MGITGELASARKKYWIGKILQKTLFLFSMRVIKKIKYFDFFIELSNIDTSTRVPLVYTCYKYCISLNSDINIVHFTYCH